MKSVRYACSLVDFVFFVQLSLYKMFTMYLQCYSYNRVVQYQSGLAMVHVVVAKRFLILQIAMY